MYKRTATCETMKQKQIDVLILQETHSYTTNANELAKELKGLPLLSQKTSLRGGVAILFANNFTPFTFEMEEVVKDRLLKV